jgi:hypothetical protein
MATRVCSSSSLAQVRQLSERRLWRDAELLIFGEKNVRTEVIGCMLAAIEKPQNVLNGNDVR